MKIVIIDGQGGKMGKSVIEQLKKRFPSLETYAIGTNSIATSAMLKAGATYGATGENPAIVNAQDADIIIGPIGIVMANSLLGEITPAMATAIGISKAYKILIPVNRCNHYIVGCQNSTLSDYINMVSMRTIEFKMERQGLVNKGDRVKIIEREGTSSYSYIIDPAVAMSGCFAARYRIKSEYGIVKDIRENSRGFYVIVDFDEDEPR